MGAAYKSDDFTARKAAYASAVNPFEVGTRKHRLFGKWRGIHDQMEHDLADTAKAYGFSWPPPCLPLPKRIAP